MQIASGLDKLVQLQEETRDLLTEQNRLLNEIAASLRNMDRAPTYGSSR